MYKVTVTSRAYKDIQKLSDSVYKRAKLKLLSLSENPRPRECRKLQDGEGVFRVRIGDYWILYSINDKEKNVIIHHIVHRREAYR